MKYIFTFLVGFPYHLFSQTVVIVRIDPDSNRIIAAADSKVYYNIPGYNKNDTSFGTVCKLQNLGQFNMGAIGRLLYQNLNQAKKAAQAGGDLNTIVFTYAESFKREIIFILTKIRDSISTDAVKQFIESIRPSFCQGIFFGFENEKPEILQVQFIIGNYLKGAIEVQWKVLSFLESCYCAYGGHVNEIDKEIRNQSTWELGKSVDIMKRLIQIEEKVYPLEVGEPIDILEVRPKYIHWIAKKEICEFIIIPKMKLWKPKRPI